nr:MAG TPA: hypothetical protein [Caudoviricetes sp.]DAU50997.1 MAG TPA: hypothetical protein [Caudoviricetes sp.]DAV50838.1 MAG TPA: hypothetical protein [Caudoviricetes sp.]
MSSIYFNPVEFFSCILIISMIYFVVQSRRCK